MEISSSRSKRWRRIDLPLLLMLLCCVASLGAQNGSSDGSRNRKAKKPDGGRAAPVPVVTIENFRTWVESSGKTRIIWSAWEIVTRHPMGSAKSQSLTGMQKAAYEQNRKDWDTGLRNAFWKAWAIQIQKERNAGIPAIARNFDVFQKYLDPKSGLVRSNRDRNLKRMQDGNAPIGLDGKSVNVHHVQPLRALGNNSFANLTTLNATDHQRNSKALHGTKVTRELVVMAQHFKK